MELFGTDGIRGRVGQLPMMPEFVLKLGWAFGKTLQSGTSKPTVLIGKDTRASGYMFESVLEAGLVSAGVDVGLLGPLPTPAIAYLTDHLDMAGGISISASHNPHYDNGLKFFSYNGVKISQAQEAEIKQLMQQDMEIVDPSNLGKVSRVTSAAEKYVDFCINSLPEKDRNFLQEISIAVDCAHGAAYRVAPEVYESLGARLVVIGNHPDGFNINQNVGTMSPEEISKVTVDNNCDYGIALDGDGDRLLMFDAKGNTIDGDQLLFLIADYQQKNHSFNGGVVGTQMSNIGLEKALKERNIPFERVAVGDRYVLEMLQQKNWCLGGEPSGHLLNLDKSNSCDAIIASLEVLHILHTSGKSFAELLQGIDKYAQTLINVPVNGKNTGISEKTDQLTRSVSDLLGEDGRVLIRLSGTEPVLRVMVEAKSADVSRKYAKYIADEMHEVCNC